MDIKRAISGFVLSFIFLVFFVCTAALCQSVFTGYLQKYNAASFVGGISEAVQIGTQTYAAINQTPSPEPTPIAIQIDAKAAISIESNLRGENKVIFEKENNRQFPIASLTKLMTAVVALDNYDLSATITVDEMADSQSSMQQDVKLGDILPAENFLEMMLVRSSNKSAYALAELMGEQRFVALMNQKAMFWGLNDTHFVDPTGLSDGDTSSVGDIARLAENILKDYSRIAYISSEKQIYIPGFGQVDNTDELLGEIPGIVFSKTGFTVVADGCLLLVTHNSDNNYLINVILGAGDRFSEMKKLIQCSRMACN
jgi:D-alanyl-D-alanine carboxypeptidase